jgi:CDP-diacylglycerol--glycerol-3-phosphate 3-phosphatidyltransferase
MMAMFSFPTFLSLLSIFMICAFLTRIILGPKKKNPSDSVHPLFGVYTIKVPNAMSAIRFPLGAWIFLVHFWSALHNVYCFWTVHLAFFIIALFDFLDGEFARKWNAITEDGKSLDPASDKFVTFCLGLTAFLHGELTDWALIILVAREVASIIQRRRMQKKGIDVSARWLGKIKTVVQFTFLYFLILRIPTVPGGTILLDSMSTLLPRSFILWGTLLLCFITVISLFPFFQSFSYVNNYTQSQRQESNRAWHIVILPNLFTIGNYLCGVTAVYFCMPEVHVDHRPFVILFWVLAAALFDAFDGPLARKLRAHSEFGACLDSSTDLSTFGLAVAVIISLQFSAIKEVNSLWGIVMALVYFLFVHLRLARFTKIHEEQEDKSQKSDFVGLPSPSGAICVLVLFTFFEDIPTLSILIIGISLLMYSKYKFLSHSSVFKNPWYRYLLIPPLFLGFGMLLILIFQQPFVSAHTSKALIVYFKACSWILTTLLLIYIADGLHRGRVRD